MASGRVARWTASASHLTARHQSQQSAPAPTACKLTAAELTELCLELQQILDGVDPFDIPFVGDKPPGIRSISVDVQGLLGLTNQAFAVLRQLVKTSLQRTPGVNMTVTITQQASYYLVLRAFKPILAIVPGLKAYEAYDYWPLDCLAHKVFWTTANKYASHKRARNRRADAVLGEDEAVEGQVAENEVARNEGTEAPPAQPEPSAQPEPPVQPEAPAQPEAPPARSGVEPTVNPEAPTAPTTASTRKVDDDIMDITDGFSQMQMNRNPDQEDEEEMGPFTLPPDLTGPGPTRAPAAPSEPASAPTPSTPPHASRSPANSNTLPINITSTATATATLRSISKAASTVTNTATPAPAVAPQTPARQPVAKPVTPALLRQLQVIQE
ncbi:hypothetical protein FRC07_014663 [Ceratobasidium sp. 392]|nr:hypothetical protein FRC07_014663 [Ceratobasidium sp. 392]